MRTPSFLALLSLAAPQEHRVANGRIDFEVNEYGVLTAVSPEGLSSVDGPPVELGLGFAEWFGVEFLAGGVAHEAVGPGASPDWAGRPSVEPIDFRVGPGEALSFTRAGPLEIATRLVLEGELLLVHVTLANGGPETLRGLFYTREWRAPSARGWSFPADLPLGRPAPAHVSRRVWMLDDLPPGNTTGVAFSFRPGPFGPTGPALGAVDVPLRLFRNDDWPNGVRIGDTNGISFGDYDADGWIDIFSCQSRRLMRNVGGTTWELAVNVDLPTGELRYGSSFGDYDNDGLPDIGTEPRGGCMHLFHNLGGGPNFEDVAGDPMIVIGQPCNAASETICWGDVDDDGDLDFFLPVYPPWAFGFHGNYFLENLGPTGPNGAYRLIEHTAEAGLGNPAQSARPEGAQFVDVDGDGDIDLYSNGTLYQNRSETGPDFDAMTETGSGIGLSRSLDEGAVFFDYDLDGDQDLFIVYTQRGVRLWEARGDGTFFAGGPGIIDEPMIGLDLGMSAEDWDNDGDVDFTTRQVFRRNRWIEDGARHFTVATHSINPLHLTSATPAWGDWDRDGDLDSALGNWQSVGHFYENTLYDGTVPEQEKPYVRVRVVRDSPGVPGVHRGLETEYGASVELRLHGDPDGLRRRKFVASSHGYLNQNEYALHFALPGAAGEPARAGPSTTSSGSSPAHSTGALVFDLAVDFPGRPSRGLPRIDRHVNPALGDIALADLVDREIVVLRNGRVRIDGVEHPPLASGPDPNLATTGGGLALPDPQLGLEPPLPAPGPDHWVGIELETAGNAGHVMVRELVLDGQLDDPADCEPPYNLALWDVSDPLAPARVFELVATTSSRNHRSTFPVEAVLEPGHVYRCVARVRELRATAISGPPPGPGEPLRLKGGLSFQDLAPCRGQDVARAVPDPTRIYLALRTSRMTTRATLAR